MSSIKSSIEVVRKAFAKIKGFQSGNERPIVTRYSHLNESLLGGLYPKSVLTIAAISGGGKTTKLQELEEDFFNKDLNPDCDEYVLLRCNWEMGVFKLILRKLKNTLKKKLTEILFNEVKPEDKDTYNNAYKHEASDKVFYMEEPVNPDEWFEACDAFLKEHQDKKKVLITIDHIALVKDAFGNKKKSMDTLVEHMNVLTNRYDNVSFIILSQLNRDIENRKEIPNLAPQRSDLYNTDTLFHISDAVVVLHNPHKLGHIKYMLIPSKKYLYLKKYLTKPDSARSNFITADDKENPFIFWHYLKIRDIDGDLGSVKDIHVEETKSLNEPQFKKEAPKEDSHPFG